MVLPRVIYRPIGIACLALIGASTLVMPVFGQMGIGRDSLAIDRSVQITPGIYVVADAGDDGVIQVSADNVVLDFGGATLQGLKSPAHGRKESYNGCGILVRGRKNVVIKRAKIHGFQHAIRAVDCEGLKIEDCDLSHSRGERIGMQGRAINSWLELRNLDGWRRYGAGLWLEKCRQCTITGVRATGAQNGILLAFSERCKMHDCDVSFNSGWGIGLWSSSDNQVSCNRADFCNRAWERGEWGADSAGIALATESHRNYIVGNSLTYGGDGFFLTDGGNNGQRTSNENLIAYNDGSWSYNNAFESTFSSRNVFYRNLANDSRYGFWLGYSSDNIVAENRIERIGIDGINIENGHRNRLAKNFLSANLQIAIHLYENNLQVGSRDSIVLDNTIVSCAKAFGFEGSTGVFLAGNSVQRTALPPGFSQSKDADRPAWTLDRFAASAEVKRIEEIWKSRPRDFKFFSQAPMKHGFHLLQLGDYTLRDFRSPQR